MHLQIRVVLSALNPLPGGPGWVQIAEGLSQSSDEASGSDHLIHSHDSISNISSIFVKRHKTLRTHSSFCKRFTEPYPGLAVIVPRTDIDGPVRQVRE